jgi:hypothetical protein
MLFVGTLGCFGGGVWWMLHSMDVQAQRVVRHEDLHHRALQAAEADPRAVALLGSPMRAAEVRVQGRGRTSRGVRMDFTFPVQGPQGQGLVQAQALLPRPGSPWQLEQVDLQHAGGLLGILPATAPAAPAAPLAPAPTPAPTPAGPPAGAAAGPATGTPAAP